MARPRPVPSGLLGQRIVEPLEGLEQPSQIVGGDADPGVGHRHVHVLALVPDLHQHASSVRELDGVGHEVQHHLLDPRAVALDGRQPHRHVLLELHALVAHQRERGLDALLDHVEQVHLLLAHLELAGLDAGEVEDAGDQLEQVAARVVNRAHVGLLPLGEVAVQAVQQHLGEANDRVQRGPQLVRHVGQELRLEATGLHQPGVGSGQALVQPGVLQRDRRLGGQQQEHVELLIVVDLARELLAEQEDAVQLVLDLQRHDQRGLDRFELALRRLEVFRDTRVELGFFLDQQAFGAGQPLHDGAVGADRVRPRALLQRGLLAVVHEDAGDRIVDHQGGVGGRDAADQPVHQRVHQLVEVQDRAHPLAEVQERLVAALPLAEHHALDAVVQSLTQWGQQQRDDGADRHDDPERAGFLEVEVVLGHRHRHAEQDRDDGADQRVHRGLLHRHRHREEAVADDRGAEHQREDHVGRDAHRVHEVGGRDEAGQDEAGEVHHAAGQAHQGAEQDERAAVAAEAGVEAPVGPHHLDEAVDHEAVEEQEVRQVERTGGRRPAPIGALDPRHEQRGAREVDQLVDEGAGVGQHQRGAVPGGAVEEDQDEVVVEGRQRDDADVDEDLGQIGGPLVGAGPQQEDAKVPQRHRGGEIGEDPVEAAPRVAQERQRSQGDVEDERYEREKIMRAHAHSPRMIREEGGPCPSDAGRRSRPSRCRR